jgi:predicted glycosyltransferase
MSAVKKKSETCEEQLRRMCKNIADSITSPEMVTNEETGEKQEETASSWMEGTYDIRYYVRQDKSYLGAEIMVAGGGPTIWVNTYTKQVEGYWGGDKVLEPFIDNLDLDYYCEEMYGY